MRNREMPRKQRRLMVLRERIELSTSPLPREIADAQNTSKINSFTPHTNVGVPKVCRLHKQLVTP